MDTTNNSTKTVAANTTTTNSHSSSSSIAKPPSSIPQPYTLKQAFLKKCVRENRLCYHHTTTTASLEKDMLLEGISDDDKQAMINHYEYRNNPLSSSGLPPPYNKY